MGEESNHEIFNKDCKNQDDDIFDENISTTEDRSIDLAPSFVYEQEEEDTEDRNNATQEAAIMSALSRPKAEADYCQPRKDKGSLWKVLQKRCKWTHQQLQQQVRGVGSERYGEHP